MTTEAKPTTARPVVLVPKGCLGDKAIHDLREAGYVVVQSKTPQDVKQFYPDSFNAASDRAKISTFNYFIDGGGPFNLNKNDLRELYVNCLKKEKAF